MMAENSAKTRRFIVTKFLTMKNDKKTWTERRDEPAQKFWMSVCRPKCLDLTPIRFSNPTLTLLTHANIKRIIKFVKDSFVHRGICFSSSTLILRVVVPS